LERYLEVQLEVRAIKEFNNEYLGTKDRVRERDRQEVRGSKECYDRLIQRGLD